VSPSRDLRPQPPKKPLVDLLQSREQSRPLFSGRLESRQPDGLELELLDRFDPRNKIPLLEEHGILH
jgi:hypothetical protein